MTSPITKSSLPPERISSTPPTPYPAALYAAVHILHGPRPELLEGYRWAEEFLRLNPTLA